MNAATAITPGLVCSHHHLYSALARGMPAPPRTPSRFAEILELVWWRLDRALDLTMLEWSAKLGALEALEAGCTAIVDHHESPNAIEGSLDVIAASCAEVGVRVSCCYGVTDRHGLDGARRGLVENERFLAAGGLGYVGVHAAFTCSDETLAAAADLACRHGVGVHIHVAEGMIDANASERLAGLGDERWLLVHGVHLQPGHGQTQRGPTQRGPTQHGQTQHGGTQHGLAGTIVHNPRSNMNNAVGYGNPVKFGDSNPVALGTDGIGADMLEEFRLAYARLREHDVTASPEVPWEWLANGWRLMPEARHDTVRWSYPNVDPWHLAYTPGVRAIDVTIGDQLVLADGIALRVDADEVRAKAAEQAQRLFLALEDID